MSHVPSVTFRKSTWFLKPLCLNSNVLNIYWPFAILCSSFCLLHVLKLLLCTFNYWHKSLSLNCCNLSFRYEGTGRSLSLKLIQQLREQSTTLGSANKGSSSASFGRSLQEITLNESIRYAPGDEVERWLNHLLCLDATVVQKATSGCPLPENCDLYP